ncbi:MAG: SAM-dependent methyltransferase, partial [Pseudomonas sp.]|nr:SAM-dependent methyltransferase [Pseudomonas sp.]
MIEQAFAQADPDWLRLQGQARQWLGGPLGELLLAQQRPLLEAELARFFGGYLVHYGPGVQVPVAAQIQRTVRVGAPFSGVEIACEEQAWPLGEHAADVVVLQHGLDFSLS